MEYLRAYRADGQSSDDGPISFIASTEAPARDGMVIAAEGWDLVNFKRNNVFLWAHDWFGSRPPIGKVDAKIDKEAKVLRADVTFDRDDEFAAQIERKYRGGFLNAVSVGFDIRELNGKGVDEPGAWVKPDGGTHIITKAELLELSGVPVPADPKALAERQASGYADLADMLARITDDPSQPTAPEAEVIWPGTALLMARLFLDMTDDADDEARRTRYRDLERRYRALGKEPPEFLSRVQLAGLDDETIRGVFLAGEGDLLGWDMQSTEARKGAVLSGRNYGDLEQSITLIRGVLDRATKEEPVTEEDAERAFLTRLAAKPTYDVADFLSRLTG